MAETLEPKTVDIDTAFLTAAIRAERLGSPIGSPICVPPRVALVTTKPEVPGPAQG